MWGSEPEAFSGSVIQTVHSEGDIVFRDGVEAHLLGKELPDQTIHVFVGAALPGRIGMGKEKVSVELFGNPFMLGELFAIVRRKRMNRPVYSRHSAAG